MPFNRVDQPDVLPKSVGVSHNGIFLGGKNKKNLRLFHVLKQVKL